MKKLMRTYRHVNKEDVVVALHSLGKDKSLGPNAWSVEFYLELFDLLGEDLQRLV